MMRCLLLAILIVTNISCRSQIEWSDVFVHKGIQYLNAGKYDEAVIEFDKARHMSRDRTDVYLVQGEAYFKMGKWLAALECFNTYLLSHKFQDPKYYVMRAKSLEILGNSTDEIISLGYDPAIALEPKNGQLYYQRGKIHERAGQVELAENDFRLASELGFKV